MSETKTVAIVGAGFTGRQIAASTVENGFNVNICDIKQDVLEDAKQFLTGVLKRKSKLELTNNIKYLLILYSPLLSHLL